MFSLLYAVVSVALISLTSLVGIFAISLKESMLDRILSVLLSFSVTTILGTTYMDLLPETVELFGEARLSAAVAYVTIGFLGFFFLERFIYWYHGYVHEYESFVDQKMTVKRFVYLNVISDGIHNLVDGMIIAAAFLIAIPPDPQPPLLYSSTNSPKK